MVILLVLLGGALLTGSADDEGLLDLARDRLRRGLLSEAEQAIARMGSDASPGLRGRGDLLAGNAAYERADLDAAKLRWSLARALLAEAGDEAGIAAADQNLRLAEERLVRRDTLERARSRLAHSLAGAIGFALAAIAALARRG